MFSRTASDKRPSILLAATYRWPVAARLAMRFANAGCHVAVVCPRGNPASRTSGISRLHTYHSLAPLQSFRHAIHDAPHDLVVPCDDLAAAHLHELYEDEVRFGRAPGPIVDLINRSLGAPKSNALVTDRNRLLDIARSEGITVPKTAAVRTLDELREWLVGSEFPVVLKADGTAAGIGVRIVQTRAAAERAFIELGSPPAAMRVFKRAVVDRDFTLVLPFLVRNRHSVTVQSFIPGRDATTSIACWEGKLLASVTFEVLRATKSNGPASVLRRLENRQISETSVKLIQRLSLSGLYGLDFKLDHLNVAYLLEMNPRATQSSHLNLGDGHDPIAELVAALSGRKCAEREAPAAHSVIALFPNEWQHNPTSHFLRSAYHDVPWAEPELVRACMKKQSRLGKWSSSAGLAEIRSKLGWLNSNRNDPSQDECRAEPLVFSQHARELSGVPTPQSSSSDL